MIKRAKEFRDKKSPLIRTSNEGTFNFDIKNKKGNIITKFVDLNSINSAISTLESQIIELKELKKECEKIPKLKIKKNS